MIDLGRREMAIFAQMEPSFRGVRAIGVVCVRWKRKARNGVQSIRLRTTHVRGRCPCVLSACTILAVYSSASMFSNEVQTVPEGLSRASSSQVESLVGEEILSEAAILLLFKQSSSACPLPGAGVEFGVKCRLNRSFLEKRDGLESGL